MGKTGRLIWMLIGLVVASYVGILALSVLKNRLPFLSKKSKPAATATAAALRAAGAATNAVPEESGLPVTERVQKWTKGARLLEESESLLNSSRFAQAKDKLLQAGELVPHAVDQMYGMARVYLSEHDFNTAEKLLVRVIEANPSHVEARNLLAKALLENGKNAEALAVAEWICTLDPYSEEGHDIASTAALSPQVNEIPKAIEHLKKLLNLKTDDPTVKNNLGKAYFRVGDFANARKIFEEILRGDDQNSAAHYNLAICQAKQGLAKEASATLTRAGAKLGDAFVATWLSSTDFDSVRTSPEFAALKHDLAAASTAAAIPTNKPPSATP